VIQPNGLVDDFSRKAEAAVRVGRRAHARDPAIRPNLRQPDNTLGRLMWTGFGGCPSGNFVCSRQLDSTWDVVSCIVIEDTSSPLTKSISGSQ
jgi:hypothetical protein